MTEADPRAAFDLPEGVAYLNCAYLAPLLHAVREAGEGYLAARSRPWETEPKDFFAGSEKSRELFARLIGGDADGVALVPSASYGLAVAAKNVTLRNGERIVVLDEQFPSNYYPWKELARERGARLDVVKRPEDHDWTRVVTESLEEDVAVVSVPNVHWTDGSLVDLGVVGGRAREVGAALVVDATQSLGAMPFDVAEVKPDFLVAAGYKWLLGPYGGGFLYVADRHREGSPVEHNWLNRAGSEDFARLTNYTDHFQPGARRFDAGGRAASIVTPMANAALGWLLEKGVANISSSIAHLTDMISSEAARRGMPTVPKNRRGPHMVGLRLGPDAPQDLTRRLAEDGVHVSVRGRSLRVSPHVYNSPRDVGRLFEKLDAALPSG